MVERTLAPNWEYFELLFDLRRLIEQQIARTAAERLEDEHVADIEAARDRYRDAGSDREASRVADRELHAAIARATKNPLLGNLSRQLRAQISLGFEAEPYSAAIRADGDRAARRARPRRSSSAAPEDAAAARRGALLAHRGRDPKAAREGAAVSRRTRYILERILLAIPTLLAMSVFVFLLIRLVPGDPVQTMLGFRATPQNVATIRHQLHLDEPLVTQYRRLALGPPARRPRPRLRQPRAAVDAPRERDPGDARADLPVDDARARRRRAARRAAPPRGPGAVRRR